MSLTDCTVYGNSLQDCLHFNICCTFVGSPRATFISDQTTMNSGIPKLILRFDNLLEGLENSLKVIVLMVITGGEKRIQKCNQRKECIGQSLGGVQIIASGRPLPMEWWMALLPPVHTMWLYPLSTASQGRALKSSFGVQFLLGLKITDCTCGCILVSTHLQRSELM